MEKLIRKKRVKNFFSNLFFGKSKPKEERERTPKRERTPCGLSVPIGTGPTACDCRTCYKWRRNN